MPNVLKKVNFKKNCMMRFLTFLLVFNSVLLSTKSYSQEVNDCVDKDTACVKVQLYSSAFFDNKEFTSKIKKGYTYPGFFFQPRLFYKPSSKTYFSVGFHSLYFAGADSLDILVPVLTFKYSITNKFDFLLGSIDSKQRHFLPEPLYKPERLFISYPEAGVQFLANTNNFKGDLWINWERYIKNKSPFQEQFTIGFSSIYSVQPFDESKGFYFPLHLLATHQGGQIDTTKLPVTSLVNIAGGIGYNFPINEKLTLGVESLFLMYKDISPKPHYTYKTGNAIYPKIFLKGNFFRLDLGYWQSSTFVNPRGEELFGSISTVDTTFNQKERNLVTAKFMFSKMVAKGFIVELRLDVYNDVKSSTFDYSYTFRMIFDDQLFFPKLK